MNTATTEMKSLADVQLPVLEWEGVRVVTTETLAKGYGSDVANIRKNLSRNEKRFTDGIHFFNLTGSNLKDFKNRVSLSHSVQDDRVSRTDSVGKKARSLTLWTEKGAARMSKIVDTDQAWEFFEKLEDAYFRPRPVTQPSSTDASSAMIQAIKQQNALVELVLERGKQQIELTLALLNEVQENRELRAELEREKVYPKPLNYAASDQQLLRERDELAEQLGRSRNYATIDAVERRLEREFGWHRLRTWCLRNNVKPLVLRKFQCVNAWPRGAWLEVYGVNLEDLFG